MWLYLIVICLSASIIVTNQSIKRLIKRVENLEISQKNSSALGDKAEE